MVGCVVHVRLYILKSCCLPSGRATDCLLDMTFAKCRIHVQCYCSRDKIRPSFGGEGYPAKKRIYDINTARRSY